MSNNQAMLGISVWEIVLVSLLVVPFVVLWAVAMLALARFISKKKQ